MIIITLKKGVIGIERIATEEEIILKDYDINPDMEGDSRLKNDSSGYFLESEL